MVDDWREDYNEHRPHSALAMMAPARFAKAWAQAAKEGKVIPFADPAQALRSTENVSYSTPPGENVSDSAPGGPSLARPPPCCARPAGSLRKAAAPLIFTQPQPPALTNPVHKQGTRSGGPMNGVRSR